MSGQALVDEANRALDGYANAARVEDWADPLARALEGALDLIEDLAQDSATGQFEHGRWQGEAEEQTARAERAEQKSAELAAVIARIRAWNPHDVVLRDILSAVPADVLREHDERVWREGAEWMAEELQPADQGYGRFMFVPEDNPYRRIALEGETNDA